MSRLHDMKKGLVQKLEKVAPHVVNKTMKNLENRMQKEDPEKMKAFLQDMVDDESFPYEMRQSCKKLLNGYLKGTPANVVMDEHIKEVVEDANKK
jgi:hypothetical protein